MTRGASWLAAFVVLLSGPAFAALPLEAPVEEAPVEAASFVASPVAYSNGQAMLLPARAAALRARLDLDARRVQAALASLKGQPVPHALASVAQASIELDSALHDAVALKSSASSQPQRRAEALNALQERFQAWTAASSQPQYREIVGGSDPGAAAAAAVKTRVEEFQRAVDGGVREAANDPAFSERPLKSPKEMDVAWKQLEPGLARGLKAEYDRAYREAYFDSVTGLHSRKYLDHHIEAFAAEPHYQLMGDVDHFKSVNDTFGHLTGDLTLRTVAKIWSEELGKVGEVGVRWGGEEYWGRVRGTLEQALAVAQRINERVSAEVGPAVGIFRKVTISVGVSRYEPAASQTPRENFIGAMNAADGALYYSKRNGRDIVVLEDHGDFKPRSGAGLSRLNAVPPTTVLTAAPSAWSRLRAWLAGLVG